MQPYTVEQEAAMIRFKCNKCGYRIKTPQETAGRKGKCPKCHHNVRVPACKVTPRLSVRLERFRRMGEIAVDLAQCRSLKQYIVPSLGFGLLAFMNGATSLQENMLNVILMGIGALLLANGFVLMVTQSPLALLLTGIITCTVAAWNLVTAAVEIVLAEAAGGVLDGDNRLLFWLALGLCQLVWGCRTLVAYKARTDDAAADELIEEIKPVVRALCRDYFRLPEDMVAFTSGNMEWQGQLTQSYAAFAPSGGGEFLFVGPEDVTVRERGKGRWNKKLPVEIRLGERSMEGTMSSQSIERLEQWKKAQHAQHHRTGRKQGNGRSRRVQRCPYCQKTILAGAIKCMHCGESLYGRRVTSIPRAQKALIA